MLGSRGPECPTEEPFRRIRSGPRCPRPQGVGENAVIYLVFLIVVHVLGGQDAPVTRRTFLTGGMGGLLHGTNVRFSTLLMGSRYHSGASGGLAADEFGYLRCESGDKSWHGQKCPGGLW